jgi:hypothetical protein
MNFRKGENVMVAFQEILINQKLGKTVLLPKGRNFGKIIPTRAWQSCQMAVATAE